MGLNGAAGVFCSDLLRSCVLDWLFALFACAMSVFYSWDCMSEHTYFFAYDFALFYFHQVCFAFVI